jgi:2-oxoglutarate dehydrogenase E2 component (dihydrolipoamide succinyltransferase)
MAVVVTMPQLGETVTEGTILRWMKQPGDMVAADEVLLEISTDKVDTEIPSPAAGVLSEILVPEGETVQVGTDLAVIGTEGEVPAAVPEAADAPIPMAAEAPVDAAPAAAEAPAPAAAPVPAAAGLGPQSGPGPGKRQVLSPVVRKLAAASGVDLALVPGTGQGGRITRRDLEAHIAEGGRAPAAAPPAPAAPAAAVTETPVPEVEAPPAPAVAETQAVPAAALTPIPPAAAAPPSAPSAAQAEGLQVPPGEGVPAPEGVPLMAGDEVVELSRLRQRIADNMIKAKQSAAHVWASVEVDYENLERVRRRHKEQWKATEGYSLTYLPFIARAVADALAAFPVVNSSIYPDQGKAVYHSAINLGIAIDLNQEGLVVATVRGADGLRVAGLARAIRAVADKARSDQLMPDDVSGSTFSITNPGPFGSFMTAPIINVPNTGILSTDTITKRPVVVTDEHGNDSISIRHIGYLGLTWNHQAFDGSAAVLFLQRIKNNIESWDWEQELA